MTEPPRPPPPVPDGAEDPRDAAFLRAARSALDQAPLEASVRERLAAARRAAVARAVAQAGARAAADSARRPRKPGPRRPGPLAAWLAGPATALAAALLLFAGPAPQDRDAGGGALPPDLDARELAALADLELLEEMEFVVWLEEALDARGDAG